MRKIRKHNKRQSAKQQADDNQLTDKGFFMIKHLQLFTVATFWNLLGMMADINPFIILLNFIILLCAYKYGLNEGK